MGRILAAVASNRLKRSMTVAEEIEREVVEACQRGDREAFRVLFETYKDMIYSIALRYSGNQAAAMDITQDTFVKLFSRIGDFRGESRFESWLYRMVVNSCLDHRRRLRRWLPLPEDTSRFFQAKESLTENLMRSELHGKLRSAVAKLAPELRLAVILRYTEGLSYDEIAEAMGCSAGTVASRLNRAHKDLARRLSPLSKWFGGGYA